jgi:hypothetical protein
MKSRPVAASAVLAIFFTGLYLLTPSRWFSYDGIAYALDIEASAWSNIFHPNHLLFSPINWILFQIGSVSGHPVRAIFLMQTLNALIAGITVGFFFWLLNRAAGWRRALAGAAVLGVCSVYWEWAVDPGCYAWATWATCALLWLLIDAEKWPSFGVGMMHGVTVLFHQMLVLAGPAFLLRVRNRQWAAAYISGFALTVGLAYGAAGFWIGHRTPGEWISWAVTPGGHRLHDSVFTDGSFLTLTASWRSLIESGITGNAPAIYFGVGSLIALAAIGFLLWEFFNLRKFNRPIRKLIAALAGWLLVFGLFQTFYYPGAARYRLLFLPVLIYLLAVLSRAYAWRAVRIPIFVGLIVLAGVNFQYGVRPRMRLQDNISLQRALWISQTLQRNDAFIFSGGGVDSIINVEVAYFASHVRGRSLRGYFFDSPKGDLTELTQLVRQTRTSNGRVYLEGALWEPQKQREVEAYGQVAQGTLAKWLGQFKVKNRAAGPGGYAIVETR